MPDHPTPAERAAWRVAHTTSDDSHPYLGQIYTHICMEDAHRYPCPFIRLLDLCEAQAATLREFGSCRSDCADDLLYAMVHSLPDPACTCGFRAALARYGEGPDA